MNPNILVAPVASRISYRLGEYPRNSPPHRRSIVRDGSKCGPKMMHVRYILRSNVSVAFYLNLDAHAEIMNPNPWIDARAAVMNKIFVK